MNNMKLWKVSNQPSGGGYFISGSAQAPEERGVFYVVARTPNAAARLATEMWESMAELRKMSGPTDGDMPMVDWMPRSIELLTEMVAIQEAP